MFLVDFKVKSCVKETYKLLGLLKQIWNSVFHFWVFHFRVWIHSFFRVSNLKFTWYFNFSFNLFLSNCWLLIFGFLQDSAVKPGFWTFFSVNCCSLAQQSRIRVFKSFNPNWYFIFQVSKIQTRKMPFSGLL